MFVAKNHVYKADKLTECVKHHILRVVIKTCHVRGACRCHKDSNPKWFLLLPSFTLFVKL